MRLNRSVVRWVSRGAVVGTLALAGVMWAGCGQTKATEFVAGVNSQIQVPAYMQTVVITVNLDGVEAFNQTYPVYDSSQTGAVVRLPRTLGVVRGTENGTVTITVAGFTAPSTADYGAFNGLDPDVGTGEEPISNGGGAQILRRSRQPYVDGQILYVPMPLRYSCYNVDCGPASDPDPNCADDSCTCKGGVCGPPDVDPTTLPPYSDPLVYGTTNTCFRPFSDSSCPVGSNGQPSECGCMDYEVTPQPIGDPSDCIFAMPGTPSAAGAGPYQNPDFSPPLVAAASTGGGLNVRAVFDNIVSEVLDYEGNCPATWPPAQGVNPQEGYCNYADAPQKFRLAPGLCQMYLGLSTAHEITLLEAAATCPSKTVFQPICQDTIEGPPQPDFLDGGVASPVANGFCAAPNVLEPAKSALYILFDKSSGMRDFLGPQGLGEVLGLSLTNPVFQQTQVGMMYTPALQTDCTAIGAGGNNEYALDILPDAGVAAPEGTVPFEYSSLAQGDIANSLLAQGTPDAGAIPSGSNLWYLEAALAGAYRGLQNLDPQGLFNRKAVMLFYDRDFDTAGPDCSGAVPAITVANQALTTNNLETYAVYLANADYPPGVDDAGVPGDPVGHGQQLAQGLSPHGQYFFNASSQASGAAAANAALALASVVADLGSCVYQVPGIFVPGSQLSFPDYATLFTPPAGTTPQVSTVTVNYSDTGCGLDDANTNPIYVFDNQHIRICQNTCQRLVTSITDNEIATGQRNQGRVTPLPPLPQDVTWSFSCVNIPEAGIVESGSAPNVIGGEDAGEDAAVEDAGGIVDAGPG
ncbi:MAG: hypothetical protein ACLQBL_14335 [Polyangiaceae bacterium]